MNKLLTTLLIAAALSSTASFAEDRYRVSMEDGKQRIDFSLNGNNRCVIIDDKIRCLPVAQKPVHVASTESH